MRDIIIDWIAERQRWRISTFTSRRRRAIYHAYAKKSANTGGNTIGYQAHAALLPFISCEVFKFNSR